MTPPSDIIWMQTGFLGDTVLTTGALQKSKEIFPEARIKLVTTAFGAEALSGHPAVDEIIIFDKRRLSLRKAASSIRAQIWRDLADPSRAVVLQAHRSLRSTLLARSLGLRHITYTEADASFLADHRIDRVGVWHETARIALLLEGLGVARSELADVRPNLSPRAEAPAQAWVSKFEPWRQNARLLGIVPGSQWETKKWPVERYLQLVQKLLAEEDINVLILGSDTERKDAFEIASSVERPVLNLAGETSLQDLRWIYPRLDLVVSNDSSSVHFASAFNIPTVAIFGPTVPEMGFAPQSERNIVVETTLKCRPCSDHGPRVCPLAHFRCMNELSVDRVLSACQELLQG